MLPRDHKQSRLDFFIMSFALFLGFQVGSEARAEEITFKKVAELSAHTANITAVTVKEHRVYTADSGGKVAASSSRDGKLIWSQVFKVGERTPDAISAMTASLTGDLLLIALKSGSICTLAAESGSILTCWKTPTAAQITSMDVARNGVFAVTGDENGTLLLWNILSQDSEQIGNHDWPIVTVRFRTDDKVLAGDGKRLTLWNTQDHRQEQTIISAGENTEGAFWFDFLGYSKDLTQVVGCSGDRVVVFDLSTGSPLGSIIKESGAESFKSAVILDSMSEIVTTDNAGVLTVWDTQTWKPKSSKISIQFGFISHFLALSEPGYFLIAGTYVTLPIGFKPAVSIWDYN